MLGMKIAILRNSELDMLEIIDISYSIIISIDAPALLRSIALTHSFHGRNTKYLDIKVGGRNPSHLYALLQHV